MIGNSLEILNFDQLFLKLKVTSHTRLRARDHYTANTLIGGRGRASPSSLHTTLEGPYICKMDVNSTWIST